MSVRPKTVSITTIVWSDPLGSDGRTRLRSTRAGLTVILPLLCLGPPADMAAAADKRWDLRLALEERYDDNIVELSDDDLDRFDEGRPGDETRNRYSIESTDDFVTTLRAAFDFDARWRGDVTTTFDATLSAHQHLENSIKDYESIRLGVEQGLHPGRTYATALAVSWSVTPDYYLRNLVDEESEFALNISGYRLEASYREKILVARLEQVLVPRRLRFESVVGREIRDYNGAFNERDSESPLWEAAVLWEPHGDARLRLRVTFRREDLQAEGDLPDTIFAEDDISHRREILRGEARFRWGPGGLRRTVRLSFEAEDRDYTTDDPNDIFHYGRHDDRTRINAGLRVELRRGWYISAEYEREENRSDFPSAIAMVLDPDETTDFTANRVTFAFGYVLSGRVGGP